MLNILHTKHDVQRPSAVIHYTTVMLANALANKPYDIERVTRERHETEYKRFAEGRQALLAMVTVK